MRSPAEGTLLWQPAAAFQAATVLSRFIRWLEREKGLSFAGYHDLWAWSTREIAPFWAAVWEFFGVRASRPYESVLARRTMPGACWFPGARLNYAENALTRHPQPDRPAIIFRSERTGTVAVSRADLTRQVAAVAAALREMGVTPGDRVVAYLPNIPEAVVAFLACASIGAVWSACSPDFGGPSVVDRFRQIAPKVLIAVDGYQYAGRPYDRVAAVAGLQRELPSLEQTVLVPYLDRRGGTRGLPRTVAWGALLGREAPLRFEQVPFDHPLWVLYSSGTTGLPKPIVQSHGGILLEHLKVLGFHHDLKPGDRFFWFTTTGWMMWNYLIGGLLHGATVLLYDGSPGYPDMGVLWEYARETRMNLFGTSAAYISACMKAGVTPGRRYDLSALTRVGSTGSPLSPAGFQWVYEQVKSDVWLASVSGGTDLCTAFVAGCPLLPVHAGELQCRALGASVHAFDEAGRPVVGEVGELVITEPMPSMPICFWNDAGNERYRESYFSVYPGIWRHGDWIRITPRGSAVIYGRSDATINRLGVRMGTGEIYRVVESFPEVADSLVIDLELNGRPYMPLFLVLTPGAALTDGLRERIRARIRQDISPRHVPDEILAVPEVPRTLNGKKLEVPVKRILMGTPVEQAVNPGSVSNPRSLDFFVELAQELGRCAEEDAAGVNDPGGRAPV